jgi:N-acetylneuraminic acid mutarotase
VARLPYGLRYAAVAATDGHLLIAGGSHDETATTTILSFDPATRELRHIGDLPEPITHAAAVALGSYVYIIGGRGSVSGTQSAAIFAVDAATGRSVRDGRLPQPLSDAAAIPVGNQRVWLAGGLSATGPVASVLELTPQVP